MTKSEAAAARRMKPAARPCRESPPGKPSTRSTARDFNPSGDARSSCSPRAPPTSRSSSSLRFQSSKRARGSDPATPALELHSSASLNGQEDVELSANVESVTDKKADTGASTSEKGGDSEGFDPSSKLKNEMRNNKDADAQVSRLPRQFISDTALRATTSRYN
ncbi:hypothetical protein MTO96_014965 [Rhipicephalus appendiculatus]